MCEADRRLAHRPLDSVVCIQHSTFLFLFPALLLAGCAQTVPAKKYFDLQLQAQTSKEQVSRLENQLADEQKTVRNLQQQVANVRGINMTELKELTAPVRISIESPSGGYTVDNKPGDAGIVLYIRPIDRDGDPIKAAGSLRVTLLDLSRPSEPKVISTYDFDPQTLSKMWYGRLLTNHYTVRCPWPPSGAPKTDKVTAVVEFTDLLTGRVFTTQEAFDITLPPKIAPTQPS